VKRRPLPTTGRPRPPICVNRRESTRDRAGFERDHVGAKPIPTADQALFVEVRVDQLWGQPNRVRAGRGRTASHGSAGRKLFGKRSASASNGFGEPSRAKPVDGFARPRVSPSDRALAHRQQAGPGGGRCVCPRSPDDTRSYRILLSWMLYGTGKLVLEHGRTSEEARRRTAGRYRAGADRIHSRASTPGCRKFGRGSGPVSGSAVVVQGLFRAGFASGLPGRGRFPEPVVGALRPPILLLSVAPRNGGKQRHFRGPIDQKTSRRSRQRARGKGIIPDGVGCSGERAIRSRGGSGEGPGPARSIAVVIVASALSATAGDTF